MQVGEIRLLKQVVKTEDGSAFTLTSSAYTVYDGSGASVASGTPTVTGAGTASQTLAFAFTPASVGEYRVVFTAATATETYLFDRVVEVVASAPPSGYITGDVLAQYLTAAGFDTSGLGALLDDAAAAGVAEFEGETGRKWSGATETRTYDRPLSESGILLLDGELSSLTSLSIGGVAQVRNTNFWLLPNNGPVYTQVRLPLTVASYQPGTALYQGVSITGVWGRTTIPADARLAMIWLGLGNLLPLVLASSQAAGTTPLVQWEEGGVSEKYTDFQSALVGYSEKQHQRTVARYQNWRPG